ncbi:hypothetical protein FRC20_004338 [Serendipita sp. 405]|nr:hypothetical protein FRC20_004338 [Serendipita sp. 405]
MNETRNATPPLDPVAKSQYESEVQSTPNSNAIGSASGYMNDFMRENTAKWHLGDVEKTKTASIFAMLHAFTRRICTDPDSDPKEVLKTIIDMTSKMTDDVSSNSSTTAGQSTSKSRSTPRIAKGKGRGVLAEEKKWNIENLMYFHSQFVTAENEKDSYSPWVKMTNTALELLRDKELPETRGYDTEIDIILQHNDPNILRYAHNDQTLNRKPDSIFMPISTARMLHGCKDDTKWTDVAENHANKSPKKTREDANPWELNWGDAFSSVEYKRKSAQKVDPQPGDLFEESLKDFGDILRGEKIWTQLETGKKRKRSNDDERQDDNAVKSRKIEISNSSNNKGNGPLSGPSHSSQSGQTGSSVPPRTASSKDWSHSVAIQSAEYGLNRLCCSFDITHTFIFVLIDTTLYISWYDHEGIITTSGFDVAKYLSHYLALLYILQRFNRNDWGRCEDPRLDTNPRGDHSNRPSPDKLVVTVQGKKFTFDLENRPVHKTLAISGRTTSVWDCEMQEGDKWKGNYVIKFSWKEKSRESEGEIMNQILEKANNRPEIINYIPRFIACEVFSGISTKDIRTSLGVDSHTREFVVVVMEKLDGKISDLEGDEFWDVIWDCFDCHYHLWKLGIRHRDISEGNLMYWRDPKTKAAYGVLIDYDLTSTSNEASNNKQRTGTRPFMAIPLLGPVPVVHKYQHDVESFFWVALYVLLCVSKDAVRDCPMSSWGNLGSEDLQEKKFFYINISWNYPAFKPWQSTGVTRWSRWHSIRDIVKKFQDTPCDTDGLYLLAKRAREASVGKFPLKRQTPRPDMPHRESPSILIKQH